MMTIYQPGPRLNALTNAVSYCLYERRIRCYSVLYLAQKRYQCVWRKIWRRFGPFSLRNRWAKLHWRLNVLGGMCLSSYPVPNRFSQTMYRRWTAMCRSWLEFVHTWRICQRRDWSSSHEIYGISSEGRIYGFGFITRVLCFLLTLLSTRAMSKFAHAYCCNVVIMTCMMPI